MTDSLARQLRGFGPLGLFAILAIVFGNVLFLPLSALLVLLWVYLSHTPWSGIGYVRQKRWIGTVLTGIVCGCSLKLAMKAIVMPLLGAPDVNPPFHYLAHNAAAIPSTLYLMIAGAGFGEETVFRGFLFERLETLLGKAPWAKVATVVITSLWFGFAHYSFQGKPGVQQAVVVGLVFGTIFAMTGRIWFLMIAHATFDLTAYALIYWDLETAVAHWVFR